jgi:hypothetical protein
MFMRQKLPRAWNAAWAAKFRKSGQNLGFIREDTVHFAGPL